MSQASESGVPATAGLPTARPASIAGGGSPLSQADFEVLRNAAAAYRPVRTAAWTATLSALAILAIAVLAVPFLVTSPGITQLILVAGLWIIGYLEYRGAGKMRRALPEAASHLGWNQVAFIALICVYCTVRIVEVPSGGYLSREARDQLSQVPELAAQLEAILPLAIRGIYVLVMVLSAILQGSLAAYYFTRKRHLQNLQRSTPEWVRRTLEVLGGV